MNVWTIMILFIYTQHRFYIENSLKLLFSKSSSKLRSIIYNLTKIIGFIYVELLL